MPFFQEFEKDIKVFVPGAVYSRRPDDSHRDGVFVPHDYPFTFKFAPAIS